LRAEFKYPLFARYCKKWLGPAALCLLGFFSGGQSQAQQILLAFDNTLAPKSSLDGLARTRMLIRNMNAGDVKQAMFFIRGNQVTEANADRLALYEQSGQLLVNAGFSATPYHRRKSFAWPIDIMKADGRLETYTNYHKHVYLPFTRQNGDEALLQQLQQFLGERNYLPVYVTHRVPDDYMDVLYQQRLAGNRQVDIRALEAAYIAMVIDQVEPYDARARLLLGYSPTQVLLLHENDVTAYCILGLIDALNARGYRILAPEKVLNDPASNPQFWNGHQDGGYMPAVTLTPEPDIAPAFARSSQEEQRVKQYLRSHGLDVLVP
jgi:hypothetical protein